jgi:alcohol dehydrogenase
MKAVLLTGHGGLEKLEYREDVPTPKPAEVEVLIAVDAAGINNTDVWTREGAYGTEDDPATTSGWRRGTRCDSREYRVRTSSAASWVSEGA